MASFEYLAVDKNGRSVKGVAEADSARQLRQNLRQKGLMPTDVSETLLHHQLKSVSADSAVKVGRLTISTSQLSILTRQLSVLLNSGLSLSEALEAVSEQSETHKIKSLITQIKAGIKEGQSLSVCLAKFPRIFDRLYVSSVSAGEQSGGLVRVLDELAEHTEREREFRQKTLLALVYPVMVAVLSFAIVVGLMVYIVPQVVGVFEESGQSLPLLTRSLIAISEGLQQWGIWLALAVLLIAFGVKLAMANVTVRYRIHKIYLHAPLLKVYSRSVNSSRYAQTLGMLSESGVPLSQGLLIAERVVLNDCFKKQLAQVSQKVVEGETLSKCLMQTELFPPLMVHMLASGEASGQLSQMLKRSSQQQQNDLKAIIATGIALFEPLMLLVMGGVVMLIVLAILVPILSMNQLVS